MKGYKVHATIETEDGEKTVVRYAGTQADARATRETIVNEFHVNKKKVAIDDCEIPTSPKEALLDFINDICKGN